MGGVGRAGRLRRRRAQRPTLTDAEISDLTELRKWLVSHGMPVCLLEDGHFPDTGRGLRSSRRLQAGQLLVAVPRKLIITTRTVLASRLGPFLARNAGRLSPVVALCLFLLVERSRGDLSFWWPYLRTLPTTFTTPLYFDEAELEAALPPDVVEAARLGRARVSSSYDALRRLVDGDRLLAGEVGDAAVEQLTAEGFLWAWHVVNTRSLYSAGDSDLAAAATAASATAADGRRCCVSSALNCLVEKDVYSLVPFVDLLNHSPSAKVACKHNSTTDTFDVLATDGYAKYEQVFLCYGPHSNRTLLIDYGFVLPHNPQSFVPFSLEEMIVAFADLDVNQIQKLDLITSHNLHRGMCCDLNGPSWSLIATSKILAGHKTQSSGFYQDSYLSPGAQLGLTKLLQAAMSLRLRLQCSPTTNVQHAMLCKLLIKEELQILEASNAIIKMIP